MSDPLWPEHWCPPEELKRNLMGQDFNEEEADAIIEGLRYVLRGGEGIVLRDAARHQIHAYVDDGSKDHRDRQRVA